jgi:hypothetical protein
MRPSEYSLVSLLNVDDSFEGLPSSNLSDSYNLSSHNDVAVFSEGPIDTILHSVSHAPGVISSRNLILTETYCTKEIPSDSKLVLISSMEGKQDLVVDSLMNNRGVYALYSAVGIYDTVALVDVNSDDEDFLDKKHVRRVVVTDSDRPIVPINSSKPGSEISSRFYDSRNKYEGENYEYSEAINKSYAMGCIAMAQKIVELEEIDGKFSMIYAPLRGALPIVNAMLEAYKKLQPNSLIPVLFPVTSSFVTYPEVQPFISKKGKRPASGRTANILELNRLLRGDAGFDPSRMLYVDEIISGGMMMGHINEMVAESLNPAKRGVLIDKVSRRDIDITVMGLMHAHGKKFGNTKKKGIDSFVKHGMIDFHSFGVEDMVTEDQRFLLGQHYLDYNLGPHGVPFVDNQTKFHPEHTDFWDDVANEIDVFLPRGED